MRLERRERRGRQRVRAESRVRREVQGATPTEVLEEPAGLREELEPEESWGRAEHLDQAAWSEPEGLSQRGVPSGQVASWQQGA